MTKIANTRQLAGGPDAPGGTPYPDIADDQAITALAAHAVDR